MSTRLETLFSRTAGSRRWRFWLLLAGIVIVPLTVAGFFAGALTNVDKQVDTIPAIIVNNDAMVTTTAPDGSKQPILAGRQLVTELTGPDTVGFSWTISNAKDAKAALASGSAYAVLTVPKDFSKSIQSISTNDPKKANLSIRTDDAHSYIAGSAAQSVGSAMTSAFGKQITTQYLSGLYQSLAGVGGSLTSAAGGATKISSGASGVATGLDSLASGAASAASGASSAASGASQLSDAVSQYSGGVDQLNGGIAQLNGSAGGLSSLSSGVSDYTSSIGTLSQALSGINSQIQSNSLIDAATKAKLQKVTGGLAGAASGGSTLSGQTASAISGVQNGISGIASASGQLAGGSGDLRSGASGLASGVNDLSGGVQALSSGTASAASGAHQVASGAKTLATGLSSGAKQASTMTSANAKKAAAVVADPVGVTVSRANPINGVGKIIGMVIVPIGLWVGALALFLLMRPLGALALASTASTARIIFRGLAKAIGIAVAQALALTVLVHTALGVPWSMLPSTLAFSLLLAVVFVILHYLLTIAFGRAGIVVSLVLLALQLTLAGGLLPVQIVSSPFQALSPLLPLTYAVQGMQGIVSGVGGGAVGGPALVLALFAVGALVLSYLLVAAKRGARSFGFALARG